MDAFVFSCLCFQQTVVQFALRTVFQRLQDSSKKIDGLKTLKDSFGWRGSDEGK